jgi:hypothetical protein
MNGTAGSKIKRNNAAVYARSAMRETDAGAPSLVVNRTHRVVRERARVMQEQRNRTRSLMLPLAICGSLLLLTCLAVWTGLYQYEVAEAAEAVQADVTALADSNNHMLVVLLWFVPVSIALLAAVWLRRSHNNSNDEAF